MRTTILDYLKTLKVKGFTVSQELPFVSGNLELPLRNPKKLYVSSEQRETVEFVKTFTSAVYAEQMTISVYFSTDAKQTPSDLDAVRQFVAGVLGLTIPSEYFRREYTESTEYENDLIVFSFDFKFTKLTT